MIEISVILLVLPNGDTVLQRRDEKTNVSSGLLGFFGGHVETGETPEAAIKRELAEETSLDVSSLDIRYVTSVKLPHPNDATVMRIIHLFKAAIRSDDFTVFEGERAETYPVAELKRRPDLAPSVKYIIDLFG